ncbi:MAG TPA: MobA/MobL family protein [Steroidobacteraceae bacterium]|jgi:hypothetical protein|nr:MobA/MobL family protein [Steroidobacteraceae bacterium]
MAIYYLGVKSFGRSAGTGGSVSTNAAAYRSGERIRDERSGRIYDHSHRRDVEYKEILLPSHLDNAGARPDWAKDRSQLWNAVERSEPRANARVAREYVLALPHEMNATQRTVLARSFAQEISNHYRNVVDLALHQPRTDPRNFHAHLLTTTREVTPQGFGAKTIAELNGTQRFELGLPRAMEELVQVRELWAEMTNEHLLQAGIEARVFHRRPEAAQVQREARPWLPRIAWEIEKRGERSIVGDRVRAQFNQRQAARQASLAKDSNALARQSAANWAAYRAGVLSEQNPETHRQRDSLRRELGHDGFSL